jgi:diguanylate cyclase (GGDEF)-like protein
METPLGGDEAARARPVTLRTRLTLFFVGIVVLPLAAATLALQLLSNRQAEARADSRLRAASRAVTALWQERLHLIQRDVSSAAEEIAPLVGTPELGSHLETIRAVTQLDFLVIRDSGGAVLGAAVTPAEFSPTVAAPSPEQLAGAEEPPGVLRTRVDVASGDRQVVLIGGRYADRTLAAELARATGVEVAILAGGQVLAATAEAPADLPPDLPDGGTARVDGEHRSLLVPSGPPGDGVLLLARSEETSLLSMWGVAAVGLVVATILGSILAGVIARPLERLAEGARAVAGGNLETRVEAGGAGDVARVAQAFNTMTEYLRTYVGELESSRDELRRNLDRMGGALQRTLDLQGMLEVVLDTAAVTLGAAAGALFLRRPTGSDLGLEVAQGYGASRGAGLAAGEGIAGRAAEGQAVLVPRDEARAARPVEPEADTAMAVPLVRGLRIIGVIALYGRATLEPFDEDDVRILTSFAGQASVAIENVLLHQETRQLSITDGLTGVWNRRYLELSLRKEIERASRFDRPLSVLLVDIDRFKRVNDRFGHQRGDEVLVDLTQRLIGSIRTQIDFVSRYGGEEFVLVLPETACEGATVVAEKVRSAIRDAPFDGDSEPALQITVSVGVASYPTDGLTAEDLIRASDQAMYRAKRAGRDRVETASAA